MEYTELKDKEALLEILLPDESVSRTNLLGLVNLYDELNNGIDTGELDTDYDEFYLGLERNSRGEVIDYQILTVEEYRSEIEVEDYYEDYEDHDDECEDGHKYSDENTNFKLERLSAKTNIKSLIINFMLEETYDNLLKLTEAVNNFSDELTLVSFDEEGSERNVSFEDVAKKVSPSPMYVNMIEDSIMMAQEEVLNNISVKNNMSRGLQVLVLEVSNTHAMGVVISGSKSLVEILNKSIV